MELKKKAKALEQKQAKEPKMPAKEHRGPTSVSYLNLLRSSPYNKKGEKLILKHCKECDKIGSTYVNKWKISREAMQSCWQKRKITRKPSIYFKKETNSFPRAL